MNRDTVHSLHGVIACCAFVYKALLVITFASVIDGFALAATPVKRVDGKPNVLLIMTDDQGYGDLRFHGNDKIDTPVLDRLAKESTRFDRFMVCPLCSMTRATLLTGRYNLRTGCASVTRGIEAVRPDEVLISEVLKRSGYATGCFGKWHIGEHFPSHPNGQGFDEFFGMPQGHWDDYFDPLLEHNGVMVPTNGFITDVLTDAAIEFIGQHRDEPFFCYVPYNAPHTPMQVADRYYDKYKARDLDNKPAAIYGMVQNIDENIGRLLRQLDELDIAKDTIVIFLSDNGAEGPQGSRYNAGMRGMKGSVHEGGVRVPMFVRWPGNIKANRVLHQLAAHIDLLPTIAELCGITTLKTKPLDGRSLASLLVKGDTSWPQDRMIFSRAVNWRKLIGADDEPAAASVTIPYPGSVRTQRWRAVNEGQGWQLFDMQADPGQAEDVAASNADVVTRLSGAYEKWFADVTRVLITRPTIDIGHPQWPQVKLTVPEAYFTGEIDWYNKYGFAHDWLTGWSNPKDSIWWETNVVTAGRYHVTLRYACAEDAVGTKLRVSATASSVDGVIRKAHQPNPVQRPTRIIKKRFVQTFALQSLGEIDLQQGSTRITIEALGKPGHDVCDVHSLILKRVCSANVNDRAEPFSLVGLLRDDEALNRAHDVQLQGDIAYVPGKGGSLALIDVSDLTNPKLLSSLVGLEDAETVLPMGDVLLLGTRDLLAVDVTDPARPMIVQRISDRPRIDKINGMALRGDYVLTANKSGYVTVFDVGDPSDPMLIDVLNAKDRGGLRSPHDIAVFGDHIIVVSAGNSSDLLSPHTNVAIYRIADPSTHELLPTEKWTVEAAIEASGQLRDSLSGANRVAVTRDQHYATIGAFVHSRVGIIDIKNPSKVKPVVNMPVGDIDATGMTISGKVLFVAGGECVEAIDISDPANPVSIVQYRGGRLFPTRRLIVNGHAKYDNAHDLIYRDGYLFVTAQNDNQFGILKINDHRVLELAAEKD